jgi:hypothetical protein
MDVSTLRDVWFPIASAAFACGAAYFALQPAKLDSAEPMASIVDVPEIYILKNHVNINSLARPNWRAGLMAITSALLSAAFPIWTLFKFLF